MVGVEDSGQSTFKEWAFILSSPCIRINAPSDHFYDSGGWDGSGTLAHSKGQGHNYTKIPTSSSPVCSLIVHKFSLIMAKH